MRKVLLLVISTSFLLQIDSYGQLLQGRVRAESGDFAAGVSVNFQNKANSISTNSDGTFKIMATRLPDTLVFSAVGFESYKVVITEKNIKDPSFEIVMLNTRTAMDEVVVSAAGVTRKRELGYSSSPSTGKEYRIARETYAARPITTEAGKFFFKAKDISERNGVLAKSRIITAGEVNDFNKWKMWQDYSANDFKEYSSYWKIFSNKRFTVQVTDKKTNAIMNHPLYLLDNKTKDTVWRTFTDNTGKAELWGGFFKDSIDNEFIIVDKLGNMINRPSEFSQGVNMLAISNDCNFSTEVDIAFMVDATGSMGDEIEFLKLELEDVIRATMDKYKSLTIRAASVFYRDKGDEYVTKNVGFNDDLLKAINFIKLQQAGGGGDHPEAMDEALANALDSLRWNMKARTRLLFMVMDAPPHGSARGRMVKLIQQAASMGIRIVPVACSGTDKSTEFLLRSMALATNGTYAFLTNHSGVGNSHIEPTTDKYEVEMLNGLLQRVISQFLFANDCANTKAVSQPEIIQPENILSFKLFPNPTTGKFTIESKKSIREIYISDFSGKILMRLNADSKKGRWQVDISQYPAATYLVKYVTMDNKWGAEKVILVH